MKVGITGHQRRQGIDWPSLGQAMRVELAKVPLFDRGLSSLAVGTDQLFAEISMELGARVTAVIPLEGYERFFDEAGLANYRRLLRKCEVIQLNWRGEAEEAFFEAGKFIVDRCDLLMAVWDGTPSKGRGGTADIVAYARKLGRAINFIDPLANRLST